MTILPKGTEAAFHHKIPNTTEEWGGTEGLAEVTDGRLLVTLGLPYVRAAARAGISAEELL